MGCTTQINHKRKLAALPKMKAFIALMKVRLENDLEEVSKLVFKEALPGRGRGVGKPRKGTLSKLNIKVLRVSGENKRKLSAHKMVFLNNLSVEARYGGNTVLLII